VTFVTSVRDIFKVSRAWRSAAKLLSKDGGAADRSEYRKAAGFPAKGRLSALR
jgi:hypothetical protein